MDSRTGVTNEGAASTPRALELEERNAFYTSLSIEARDRFLDALKRAAEAGLSEQEAWTEAVIAAETAYNHVAHDNADATAFEPDPADLADRDLSRTDGANL